MLDIWIPNSLFLRQALAITYGVCLAMLCLYFVVGFIFMQLSNDCKEVVKKECRTFRMRFYLIMGTIFILTTLFYTMFGQVLIKGYNQLKAQNLPSLPQPKAVDAIGSQAEPAAAENMINAV